MPPVRVAVAGKGGIGKSVIAATIARILGRRGESVLAMNKDFMPGLPCSLGVNQCSRPVLAAAVEKCEGGLWGWCLRKGLGPVGAVRQYASLAPDGVRLLDWGNLMGASDEERIASMCAFILIAHRLEEPKTFRDWAMIGDFAAGRDAAAYNWAPYAHRFLVVMEPTWKSADQARRIADFLKSSGRQPALFVVSKVTSAGLGPVEKVLGEPLFATIPWDEAILDAERADMAPLDYAPSSPAVVAIERIVDDLERLPRRPAQ